jgi:hypothetical protein
VTAAHVWPLVAALSLAVGAAPQPGKAPAENCGTALDVPNKSFQALGPPTRTSFVWVDDIASKLFGSYDPFEIYVVTGQVFPPFKATTGSLEREAFLRLTQGDYNARRTGPLRLSAKGLPAELPFVEGKQSYRLRVTKVTASTFGSDLVTVQVCW